MDRKAFGGSPTCPPSPTPLTEPNPPVGLQGLAFRPADRQAQAGRDEDRGDGGALLYGPVHPAALGAQARHEHGVDGKVLRLRFAVQDRERRRAPHVSPHLPIPSHLSPYLQDRERRRTTLSLPTLPLSPLSHSRSSLPVPFLSLALARSRSLSRARLSRSLSLALSLSPRSRSRSRSHSHSRSLSRSLSLSPGAARALHTTHYRLSSLSGER